MNLAINHFSIRTTDLQATQQFYEQVLSLTVGPRPEFQFPGVWMYSGDHGDVARAEKTLEPSLQPISHMATSHMVQGRWPCWVTPLT